MSPTTPEGKMPTALQRCDRFVPLTMNWLHVHLRNLPRYRPLVLAGQLVNPERFPEVDAMAWGADTLPHRAWRRIRQASPYPPAIWKVRRHAPVLLHSHFGYVAVEDHALRRKLGVPWVAGFYGADIYELSQQREWRERFLRLFADLDLAIALGPRMGARLEELGCPAEKIVHHVLGVELDALPATTRVRDEGDPLVVLFAGTFREKKGLTVLLDALRLLVADRVDVRLEIVGDATRKPGDAEYKREVLERVDRWGMASRLTFHSFLPLDDLVALSRRCHVLAVPSLTAASGDSEGTPTIIQQMMATAMPVVATDHADIPYTFGPLAHRLVPEGDAEALAEALRHYADHPAALAEDGRRFRERAESAFDVRTAAGRLADLYDGVVRGSPPPAREDSA